MNNFSAIIPVANMQSANDALEAQGFGPNNFTIPAYNGANPGFAALHAWFDQSFLSAVEALPNVVINMSVAPPTGQVSDVTFSVGAQWSQSALPLEGVVTPGLYYDVVDELKRYWWVIQQYDTATWPDPAAPGLEALVVPARMPGEVTKWVQPLNQFFAYYLVNPFTGLPDETEHNGQVWYVSQADGAGLNIWEPGIFGWTVKS